MTSGEDYKRTPPPGPSQLVPSNQAEFVICDQTIRESFRDQNLAFELKGMRVKQASCLENPLLVLAIAGMILAAIGIY